MKALYKAAHREARLNRRAGLWLRNPIRLVIGYPGIFVGADGRPRHFAGFNRPEMFPIIHENKQ